MARSNCKGLILVLLLVLLFATTNFNTCVARKGKHWRSTRGGGFTLISKRSKGKDNRHHHHAHNSGSSAGHKHQPGSGIPLPSPVQGSTPPPTAFPVPNPIQDSIPAPTANPISVSDKTKPSPAPSPKLKHIPSPRPAPKHSPSPAPASTHKSKHDPSPSPSPSPTYKLKPSPTPIPTPTPSPGHKSKPTPTPILSPGHKSKPAPAPVSAPTPSPGHKPKPAPTPVPAPAPSSGHKTKPVPTPVSAPTPSPGHKTKPAPTPVPAPSSGHKTKPAPTPVPAPSSGHKTKPAPTPVPSPAPSPKQKPSPSEQTKTYSVLDFGANGDGKSDDTKAFQAAWVAVCKLGSSTLLVPSGYQFLVGPISFSGPCQPGIVFQLDGTIVAPTNPKAWGSGFLQWLEFTKLASITIQGSGVIEGAGSVWWGASAVDNEPISTELAGGMPHTKPTALRFYGSTGVIVTGITIQNSPQCHLKFDSCNGVQVYGMNISSPGDSPNTDGIHLQDSSNVVVHHNQLSCGDDCVSIQTGCSNINIHHVTCGPGHGISIGGLGRGNTKACVSNVTVQNVNLQGTMTGVRIKTWQGGSGSVQNIRFSNIQVTGVQIPIMIDQYYCDSSSCKNQSSAVTLSSISYESIKGTYTIKPVHLACSDSSPCSDITLTDIELQAHQQSYHMSGPFCWNAYGLLQSPILPPVDCLLNGKPPRNRYGASMISC